MKMRLCELESEVRELAQRLSAIQNVSSTGVKSQDSKDEQILSNSKALGAEVREQAEELLMACREECRDVMTHLANEVHSEVQAMSDPKQVLALMQRMEECQVPPASPTSKQDSTITNLREDVSTMIEGLRKDIQSNSDALRAELSSVAAIPIKELQRKLEAGKGHDTALSQKVHAQKAELLQLRKEISGDVNSLRDDIQRLKHNSFKSIPASPSTETVDFARSMPLNLQNRPPTLDRDLSRGRLRPNRPPSASSTAKARKGDNMSTCSDADGIPMEYFHGMAGALGALFRVFGIVKDGSEKLGEGEWEWARAGQRLEQAWATQTKELWQFGMPLRPTVIDFLRSRSDSGLSRGAATKLPDRREGARLAERLASGLTAASCPSTSLFNDIDAAVRQLSQYTSSQNKGKDVRSGDPISKQQDVYQSGGADPNKTAFAGLEALRQMRRQKNE
jgi:hypothetical protein